MGYRLAGSPRRVSRSPSSQYFQQSGGLDLDPDLGRAHLWLERICAFLQGTDSVYDLRWSDAKTYGDIRLAEGAAIF